MDNSNRKRGIRLCDEGMTLAQGLMDTAETYEEYQAAAKLFNNYYGLKLLYQSWKAEPTRF